MPGTNLTFLIVPAFARISGVFIPFADDVSGLMQGTEAVVSMTVSVTGDGKPRRHLPGDKPWDTTAS